MIINLHILVFTFHLKKWKWNCNLIKIGWVPGLQFEKPLLGGCCGLQRTQTCKTKQQFK